MIKEIFKETCVIVSFAMLCGWFVRMAINGFKKEEYFTFGTALALAIGEIVHIINYICFFH